MKKIILFAFCCVSVAHAQNKGFFRHSFNVSLYGNFYEKEQSSPVSGSFNHQLINGMQYRYFLNEKNALRASISIFMKKRTDWPDYDSKYTRSGYSIGFEHIFPVGNWHFYVFADAAYSRGVDKGVLEYRGVDPFTITPIHYEININQFTNAYGATAGGGLRYHLGKHIYMGIEVSASWASFTTTRHYDSPIESFASTRSGKLLTFSPLRFLNVGIRF